MLSPSCIRGRCCGLLKQAQNSHRRGRHDRVISATSAAGRLKSEKATPIRSYRPCWISTEVLVGPCPAEAVTGLMEKMPLPINGHV